MRLWEKMKFAVLVVVAVDGGGEIEVASVEVVLYVIGVVDEVVFRYVSSKNMRVVLNLKDLRLSFTI